jgi:hypothetical protein
MSNPISDQAEVALEYSDKFYVGTFGRSAQFDAHFDDTGVSLLLDQAGVDKRESFHLHVQYRLLADILGGLAKTASAIPTGDAARQVANAANALHAALGAPRMGADESKTEPSPLDDIAQMSAEDEVLLLHIME